MSETEPSAPLPELVHRTNGFPDEQCLVCGYTWPCDDALTAAALAAATERATRAGSMIAASILAALDSDEGDADYRPCAGCDSIADSCRQAGCPAATPTSEAKP